MVNMIRVKLFLFMIFTSSIGTTLDTLTLTYNASRFDSEYTTRVSAQALHKQQILEYLRKKTINKIHATMFTTHPFEMGRGIDCISIFFIKMGIIELSIIEEGYENDTYTTKAVISINDNSVGMDIFSKYYRYYDENPSVFNEYDKMIAFITKMEQFREVLSSTSEYEPIKPVILTLITNDYLDSSIPDDTSNAGVVETLEINMDDNLQQYKELITKYPYDKRIYMSLGHKFLKMKKPYDAIISFHIYRELTANMEDTIIIDSIIRSIDLPKQN